MSINQTLSVIFLLTFGAVPFACGGDNSVDAVLNCAEICNTYSDCVTDIDVTSCATQCEDNADNSTSYRNSAETCEECISDGACGEIEGCWDTCPVVPVAD